MLGVFAYFLVAPFASQICSVFSNFWAATPLGDIRMKRILCIEPCFCIALSRFGVNPGGNRVGIGWIFFRGESSPLISGKNTHLFFINQQCFFLHVIYRLFAVHAHCRLPFLLLLLLQIALCWVWTIERIHQRIETSCDWQLLFIRRIFTKRNPKTDQNQLLQRNDGWCKINMSILQQQKNIKIIQ